MAQEGEARRGPSGRRDLRSHDQLSVAWKRADRVRRGCAHGHAHLLLLLWHLAGLEATTARRLATASHRSWRRALRCGATAQR